jgi:DNA-binding FrmR family transcriptional regulator
MRQNPDHTDKLTALRRIEGQVRGVQGMIEKRKYCVDILTQLHAIRGALSRVEDRILKTHLQNCVVETFQKSSEREKENKISEIIELIHQVRK